MSLRWSHTLRWQYAAASPDVPPCDIAHRIDQDSEERGLRMMIELCEVTIDRCNRRIKALADNGGIA